MKQDIHPKNYRLVVFQDLSNSHMFLIKSTAKTTETIKYTDGNEYPLVKVHISSASHPFYTGQEKLVDIEGRVDKFKARTEAAAKKQQEARTRAEKSEAKPKADKTEVKAKVETKKIGAK